MHLHRQSPPPERGSAVFKQLIATASIGAQKVTGDIVAWGIGIREYARSVHPKIWLFIGLAIGSYWALNGVSYGVPTVSLFSSLHFLLGCVLVLVALGLLMMEATSAKHNVDVLDTSN